MFGGLGLFAQGLAFLRLRVWESGLVRYQWVVFRGLNRGRQQFRVVALEIFPFVEFRLLFLEELQPLSLMIFRSVEELRLLFLEELQLPFRSRLPLAEELQPLSLMIFRSVGELPLLFPARLPSAEEFQSLSV